MLNTATFLGLLTALCDVRRQEPGAVDSETGLPVETWLTPITDIPCRFVNRTGREAVSEARGSVVLRGQVCMLPIDTDVREGDVILSGGQSYDVKLVEDAAGAGHHLEALVERRS